MYASIYIHLYACTCNTYLLNTYTINSLRIQRTQTSGSDSKLCSHVNLNPNPNLNPEPNPVCSLTSTKPRPRPKPRPLPETVSGLMPGSVSVPGASARVKVRIGAR